MAGPKVDESKAEEFKKRAEADFDPAETSRQRLERLTREVKELEAKTVAEEQAAAAAKVAPKVAELVKLVEDQNPGKVCRALTVRYVRPGDEEPEVVAEMEQGKPGITVKFRVVRPQKPKANA